MHARICCFDNSKCLAWHHGRCNHDVNCCNLLQRAPSSSERPRRLCTASPTVAQQLSRLHARQHQGGKGMDSSARLGLSPLVPPIGVVEECCESCWGRAKYSIEFKHGYKVSRVLAEPHAQYCYNLLNERLQACLGHCRNTTQCTAGSS